MCLPFWRKKKQHGGREKGGYNRGEFSFGKQYKAFFSTFSKTSVFEGETHVVVLASARKKNISS